MAGKNVGVFLGITSQDYGLLLKQNDEDDLNDAYYATGNALSTAAGRIAFTFDFRGPCLSIDTACSSSLVALHQAKNALQRGECDLAVVAGVNLLLAPDIFINFCRASMLSPEGRCKTFNASANGFARGEGGGVLLLKRSNDAMKDNDRLYALIRATGVNQDGHSSGLTVPNGEAQIALLETDTKRSETAT